MSVQALFLGHYQQATALAEAAVERTADLAQAGTRSALPGASCRVPCGAAPEQAGVPTPRRGRKSAVQAGDGSGLADLEHRTGLVLALLQDLGRAEVASADSRFAGFGPGCRSTKPTRPRPSTGYSSSSHHQAMAGGVMGSCRPMDGLSEYSARRVAKVLSTAVVYRGARKPQSLLARITCPRLST